MKTKTFFFAIAMMLISSLSFSQTYKGNWIISGNSTFQVLNTSADGSNGSTTLITFSPSVGCFVTKGLAVGVDLGLLSVEQLTIFSVLPSVSYYFPTQSQVKPYVKAGIGYSMLKLGDESVGGLSLGASGGIVYMINRSVGFNMGAQYQRNDFDGNVSNTFGGMLGLSVFF